jgi:hypothetical protein
MASQGLLKMKGFLLLLGVLLVMAGQGCSSARTAATEAQGSEKPGMALPVPFTPVLEEIYSGVSEPTARVVQDRATFRRLWDETQSTRTPTPEPPEIDFARESLVVVALGTRPSGGYRIRIEKIQERAGAVEVTVGKYAPGQNCLSTQAITKPIAIARMPRTTKPTVFRDQVVVHDCT